MVFDVSCYVRCSGPPHTVRRHCVTLSRVARAWQSSPWWWLTTTCIFRPRTNRPDVMSTNTFIHSYMFVLNRNSCLTTHIFSINCASNIWHCMETLEKEVVYSQWISQEELSSSGSSHGWSCYVLQIKVNFYRANRIHIWKRMKRQSKNQESSNKIDNITMSLRRVLHNWLRFGN